MFTWALIERLLYGQRQMVWVVIAPWEAVVCLAASELIAMQTAEALNQLRS